VSLEFLITSFIVVVSPGTGVLYTLAAGLSRGARASVVAAFGCTIGIVPHMAAAIMGLAALLHTSALAFQVFKYLGVAYLLYMAWSTLRERGALRVEKEAGARSAVQVTVTGILI
jgi:threonine/homoserine/homoserine lactone efflux protein